MANTKIEDCNKYHSNTKLPDLKILYNKTDKYVYMAYEPFLI